MTAGPVVVTGAASGIGAATVELLAARGVDVVAVDRNHVAGPAAESLRCDLADPAAIDDLVGALPPHLGGLCNVAGVPGTLPPEVVMAVNLLALRHLTDALLPRIAAGGAVVNVASCAGSAWRKRVPEILELLATDSFAGGLAWCSERTRNGAQAYDFSKEAVIVFTKQAATRAWRRGVRVNAVSPGAVDTPILADFYESMGAELLDPLKHHAGRNGRPAEIAAVIAFLLSPDAGWINGENIRVDGGSDAAIEVGELELPGYELL